VVDLLELVVTK